MMVALNTLEAKTDVHEYVSNATVSQMPLAVRTSWHWLRRIDFNSLFRWSGLADKPMLEEIKKARQTVKDVHARRLNMWADVIQGCTCRPDAVMACTYCRMPEHIKESYRNE